MSADGRATIAAEFPGLALRDQQLVIQYRRLDKDGIISLSVFSRFIAELDWETPALRLYPADSALEGPAITFQLEGNNPSLGSVL